MTHRHPSPQANVQADNANHTTASEAAPESPQTAATEQGMMNRRGFLAGPWPAGDRPLNLEDMRCDLP